MSKAYVLVVDDEENILELVKYNLSKEGYKVLCVTTGEDAIRQTRAKLPDMVILDLMLPGVDGLEVCKILKGDPKTSHIPIIMLTAKGDEADIVTGLELGADDYVTKPFSPRVLLARMKAVLRRKAKEVSEEPTIITVKEMTIDPSRHEVLIKSKPVVLTNTEFRLLYLLASRPGRVFTRYQIIDNVRGDDYIATDRSVDVQVVGLRRKLKSYGNHIETVRGVGYRFKD
jgi:two-component system phosphate regulon response regulator PhoB